MKHPNTPKQTVEAIKNKINDILCNFAEVVGAKIDYVDASFEATGKIMALLNPVEKERNYFDLSDKEKKAFVQKVAEESSAEQIRKYGKPPSDKEWEKEFDKKFNDEDLGKGKILDNSWKRNPYEIKAFIRSLLLSKDQEAYKRGLKDGNELTLIGHNCKKEADRRVSEAIKKERKIQEDVARIVREWIANPSKVNKALEEMDSILKKLSSK